MNITSDLRRSTLREDKKKARRHAALAALLGIEPPKGPIASVEDHSREAEAVLAYTSNPKDYKTVACKRCNRDFAVNRGNVAYCSDTCRAADLKDLGIEWSPGKSAADRWKWNEYATKVYEPLVVGPEALAVANVAIGVTPIGEGNSDPVIEGSAQFGLVDASVS